MKLYKSAIGRKVSISEEMFDSIVRSAFLTENIEEIINRLCLSTIGAVSVQEIFFPKIIGCSDWVRESRVSWSEYIPFAFRKGRNNVSRVSHRLGLETNIVTVVSIPDPNNSEDFTIYDIYLGSRVPPELTDRKILEPSGYVESFNFWQDHAFTYNGVSMSEARLSNYATELQR
jgi:hypothetical protein